jgi:hypothetical protein
MKTMRVDEVLLAILVGLLSRAALGVSVFLILKQKARRQAPRLAYAAGPPFA